MNKFIIKKPHVTEKATDLSKEGKYVFIVQPDATKNEIKKHIKKLYGVDVLKVATITNKPRTKIFRGKTGAKEGYKKTVVTLKKGQKIDIT